MDMGGLRERWRLKAMQTIQERALDLFDEKGFYTVTIEEIAAAAEVSPSSVYRYFGTKEGILVADGFDFMGRDELGDIFGAGNPVDGLLRVVQAYESAPESEHEEISPGRDSKGPWRRVRYFFSEPSVRMAILANLDRVSQKLAPLLAERDGMSESQARVVTNALAYGYFAALEQWYLDEGRQSIASYVEEGMRPLRRIWQPVASD